MPLCFSRYEDTRSVATWKINLVWYLMAKCCLLVTSGCKGSKILEMSVFIGLSKANILLLLSISSLILKRNLTFCLSFWRLELTDVLIYPMQKRIGGFTIFRPTIFSPYFICVLIGALCWVFLRSQNFEIPLFNFLCLGTPRNENFFFVFYFSLLYLFQ